MPRSARELAAITRAALRKRVINPVLDTVGGLNRRKIPQKWEEVLSPISRRQAFAKRFPNGLPRTEEAMRLELRHRLGYKRPPFEKPTPPKSDLASFKVGRKKVYLPNFVITLKRNPRLEPYHAVFEVPLNLSKLDLRDYLWHLYGVETISIRSSILPGVLRRKYKVPDQPRRIGPMRRTKARKKMIVQLAEPFRYPAELNKEELEE